MKPGPSIEDETSRELRRMARSLCHAKPTSPGQWWAATAGDGEGTIDPATFELLIEEFVARGWIGAEDLAAGGAGRGTGRRAA